MLSAWINYGVSFYVLGAAAVIAFVSKIISGMTMRRMVKEASEIQKSEHKLMRLMKAKFEHASMVSDRVLNVEVFAKKYMYEYKVLGMRVTFLRHLPKKMLWCSLLAGMLGVFGEYWLHGVSDLAIRYGAVTAVAMTVQLVILIMGNEKENFEAAKTYIVDYLENVCIRRYEKANRLLEEEVRAREEEQRRMEEMEEVTIPEISEKLAETVQQEEEEEKEKNQEMRIREILHEFLVQ